MIQLIYILTLLFLLSPNFLFDTTTDSNTSWDISTLPTGIYFLIGKSTEGKIIYPAEKIIKN